MIKWMIFYEGGTFSSGQGNPKDAPARGIQAIVQDHKDVGAEIITSVDYYIWWRDRWQGVSHFYDLWDFAIEEGFLQEDSLPSAMHDIIDFLVRNGYVKFGRRIDQDAYNLVMRHAMQTKDGWLPKEERR